jgi:predicted transcriptional regulator
LETNNAQPLWNRRDRLGIIAEIIEAAQDGQLKTRIMYMVNLSFSQVNEYLSFLTERGFLDVHMENGKKFYGASAKGSLYVENYLEMSNLMRSQKPVRRSSFLMQ